MSDGPPRHRGRRIALGAALVVAVLVGVVVVRWNQGRAKPVDIADVAAPTGSTTPQRVAELRPPQGVYLYEGSGTAALDTPPKQQGQGPTMPATVTHLVGGCWELRIEYSTNQWQSWQYCTADGGLAEAGGSAFQRWDFGAFANETTSTFTCEAPVIVADQVRGDEWDQRCEGESTGVDGTTISEGPVRYVGTETLDIGGEEVLAHRYHRERTTSGNQTGSEVTEAWFSVETGMPLRNERRLQATSDTIIGEVDYTEQGEFQLTSLSPER